MSVNYSTQKERMIFQEAERFSVFSPYREANPFRIRNKVRKNSPFPLSQKRGFPFSNLTSFHEKQKMRKYRV